MLINCYNLVVYFFEYRVIIILLTDNLLLKENAMTIFYTGAPIVKNQQQRKLSAAAIRVHSTRRKAMKPGPVLVTKFETKTSFVPAECTAVNT